MFKEKAEIRKNIRYLYVTSNDIYKQFSGKSTHIYFHQKNIKFLIQVYLILNNVFEIKILLK